MDIAGKGMSRNNQLLGALNKFQRADPLVRNIMGSIGASLERDDLKINQIILNLFLDSANEEGIAFYEKEARIRPRASQSLRDRASAVEAKWKSAGKADINLMQMVADSWANGRVDVDFTGGKIRVTFTSEYGLPDDRLGLELALDEIKPAHLSICYLIRYLLVRDVHLMKISDLQSHKIREFAFKGRVEL